MKNRCLTHLPGVSGLTAICGLLALPIAALAQPGPSTENQTVKPVCMARPHDDVPQVSAARRGQDFDIIAAPRSVPVFEAKGFRVVNCAGRGFNARRDFAEYRDGVCKMAAYGNEAVQNQFERALGERPAVLCANAQVLAGRWDRTTKKQQDGQ